MARSSQVKTETDETDPPKQVGRQVGRTLSPPSPRRLPSARHLDDALTTKKETFFNLKTGPSIKSRNERLRQTCPSRGPSLQTTKGPPSAWLDAGLRLERIGKRQSTRWTPFCACGSDKYDRGNPFALSHSFTLEDHFPHKKFLHEKIIFHIVFQ